MKQIATGLFAALICVGLVFAVMIGLDNRRQGEERDALVSALQQQVIDLGGEPVVASIGSQTIERGPAGPPGQDGTDGRDGRNGRDGIAINGTDGKDGTDGNDSAVPGPKGDKGDRGDPGQDSTVPGPPGPPGADGTDGVDGLPGSPPFSITIGNQVCTDPDGDLRYDCQEV